MVGFGEGANFACERGWVRGSGTNLYQQGLAAGGGGVKIHFFPLRGAEGCRLTATAEQFNEDGKKTKSTPGTNLMVGVSRSGDAIILVPSGHNPFGLVTISLRIWSFQSSAAARRRDRMASAWSAAPSTEVPATKVSAPER